MKQCCIPSQLPTGTIIAELRGRNTKTAQWRFYCVVIDSAAASLLKVEPNVVRYAFYCTDQRFFRSASQQLKAADLLAMAVQADAQNAKPETTAPMTALDFARWVVEWLPKSVVISAYIENILVTGRTGLNALTTVEQIEPFLTALATQAEAKFAELAT